MRDMNRLILVILFIVVLTACGQLSPGSVDQPVSSDDTPMPSPVVNLEKYELGESVFIEIADPLVMESFPLQVNIKITGNLPDGCTTIHQTESERDGNTFRIKILTLREKYSMCTQALVPFEVTVPLDVVGLPAGTYRVMVYDVVTEFTFTQDNIIQDSEESN